MKQCSKCKKTKPTSEFSRKKRAKDGLQSQCKECCIEYDRKWNEANKEKRAKYTREWFKANPEKKAEYDRKWRKANPEKKAEYGRIYRKDNREKIAEYLREYQRKRISEDIQFKLARNLRNRLYYAIKGSAKNGSAVHDLGCTLDEFKLHLESQFSDGMNWDNYGSWHIDHIIPLSSFDLTDREQLLAACNYTNLQPLWAKDNIKKSNKLIKDGKYV